MRWRRHFERVAHSSDFQADVKEAVDLSRRKLSFLEIKERKG